MPSVLVVAEEAESVDLLRELSAARGYYVLTASDGPEALLKVWQNRPDVVLLNSRLPTMDGLAVLRLMRTMAREVAVIMLTGASEEAMGSAALKLGACGAIAKPLNVERLERSIWYTIAAKRQEMVRAA